MHESNLNKMEVTPLLVSVPQACAIIGRGVAALYGMIGDKRIVAVKSDGRTLIRYDSLVRYVDGLQEANVAPPRRRRFEGVKQTEDSKS
jgi:hypothetical protein